jgi:muscleblind protein
MAMVLPAMFNPNVKDSRWLTLEVCREYQRSKCSRTENECKFAHPPPHVEVQNGRVTCCFDSIKGKCQRKEPPCKYLHPPQHLREQLLQNGKNNLILRNLQMQYIAAGLQPMVPAAMVPGGEQPTTNPTSEPYRVSQNSQTPAFYTYEQVSPYMVQQNPAAAFATTAYMSGLGGAGAMLGPMDGGAAAGSIAATTPTGVPAGVLAGGAGAGTKLGRPDRLEQAGSLGGMMGPMMKRHALDNTGAGGKSGIPMYQPSAAATANAAAYQQLMHLQQQQQQFVPVSIAGHPPSVPRF